MTTIAGDTFEAWKNDPAAFFRKHRDMLARITRKHCYFGHLNKHQFEKLIDRLEGRMAEESVVQEIRKYSGKAVFLVYYIRVLEKQVVILSQEDDVRLLHENPQNLMLKYQPLVSYIVSKVFYSNNHPASIQGDLEQEIIQELIEKADYIRGNYDPSLLFRNYIWSVINHSFLNQLKKRKWRFNFGYEQGPDAELQVQEIGSDYLLCLEDGFRQFREILHSYNHERAKLEICLKAAFSLPSLCSDFITLFDPAKSSFTEEEIETICRELNKSTRVNGFSQSQRFAIIEPLLSKAFKANARVESYLHWTNEQVAKIILKLNQNGLRCFNRDTFKILVEMYYMKYYCHQAPK